MGIVVDEMIGGAMDEDLLAGPLSQVLNVCLGLVTMGADDFLDFLNGFFIDLGITIFERTYFGKFVDACLGFSEEAIPAIKERL